MPSALAALTDKAAAVGAFVLVLGYTLAVVYIHDAVRPAPTETETVTDTVTVDRAIGMDDLAEATTPNEVATYEAPDSSDTQTECFQAPTWLQSTASPAPSKTTTPTATAPKAFPDTAEGLSSTPKPSAGASSSVSAGPAYAIIPTTDGSPSLSVASSEVVLTGTMPGGEGRKWAYDVPQPTWRLNASAEAYAARGVAMGTTTLTVGRRWGPAWVHVGPVAMGGIMGDRANASVGVSVGVGATLWSR